ncbi:hypothetical protein ACX93W_17840 [Paenibacillus sp. CAU 1782]
MKFIKLSCGLLLLFAVVLTACTSDSGMGRSEKQQLVENVKTLEESEFDLIYFNKSYNQYHKAVNEMVSDDYWTSVSDNLVFGYDNKSYDHDDLANMSQEEYARHKEQMLNIIHGMGMDKLSASVQISDVYEGSTPSQVHIYTIETKELKDQPFTTTTKKYSLEKINGNWLITGVEQDKLSHGSEQATEEMEEGILGLKYQTHDNKVIGYPTSFVLSGVGKE